MTQTNSVEKMPTKTSCEVGEVMLYFLPVLTPVIYKAIDKIVSIAHDAMEHGYELSVKVGAVNVSLTKPANTHQERFQ